MVVTKKVQYLDLNIIDYEESYAIQEMIYKQRRNGYISDVIIFQESKPVITIGKSGSEANLLVSKKELEKRGIDIVCSSRGGDITYHGPGQLIISPVLKLRNHMKSIIRYLRLLEQIVINILDKYGINGERKAGASGVWIKDKKIAAIGIAIKNGITQHGIAINVNPKLTNFDLIIPCGLKNTGVTSLEDLGVLNISVEKIKYDFLKEFSNIFEVEVDKNILNSEVYKDELRT